MLSVAVVRYLVTFGVGFGEGMLVLDWLKSRQSAKLGKQFQSKLVARK